MAAFFLALRLGAAFFFLAAFLFTAFRLGAAFFLAFFLAFLFAAIVPCHLLIFVSLPQQNVDPILFKKRSLRRVNFLGQLL
ncbi:uncharacterized protein METZ01_LOCUS317662 [marine metagenome]|uniref:Uncharacterized protein n=1 Tax=marine metagenome TaxID=408172 RepID=A0A382NWD1_9ZZZZ